MNPEDRVLVGVINRKRDLKYAIEQHWYRIPELRMPRGIYTEYVAFFLSGSAFKEKSGGIHYYTQMTGLELRHRRDLLPKEADHARADNVYYRVALGPVKSKTPPILNPTRRPIAFIYTTWDRFIHARTISDLYSKADHFVDRIYAVLRTAGVYSQQFWETEQVRYDFAPGVRIPCREGTLDVSAKPDKGHYQINEKQTEDEILREIRLKIAALGGPATLSIPGQGPG